MKRNLLIGLLLLGAGSFGLHAQNAARTPAAQELNLQNFWFNSPNAAALAFSPLENYSDLYLSYSREQGCFKHALSGQMESEIKASTSGALEYKGFALYGDFSYVNSFDKGCLYNANLYEPSFAMPYYVADWNLSDWKRQSYDMGLKAAFPTMADGRLAAGLELRYNDRVGAKQMDPRGQTWALNIVAAPSLAFSPDGRNTLGLTLEYERYKERTSHSCENYLVNQPVAIMRGLGYFTLGNVGGNLSVANYLYSGHKAGAALSWSRNGNLSELFTQISGGYDKITLIERPTFPQRRGDTGTVYGDVVLKANLGSERNHRLAFNGNFSYVTGYEYIQELVTSPKREWVTISVNPASNYLFVNGSISYDYYGGIGSDGYRWRAGALVTYDMFDQTYSYSEFDYMGLDATANGAYNIPVGSSSHLLASASAGYCYPLSGSYLFMGSVNTDSAIVKEFYPSELAYLTSQAVHAGLDLTFSLPVGKRNNLYIKAGATYYKPMGTTGDRIVAAISLGTLL